MAKCKWYDVKSSMILQGNKYFSLTWNLKQESENLAIDGSVLTVLNQNKEHFHKPLSLQAVVHWHKNPNYVQHRVKLIFVEFFDTTLNQRTTTIVSDHLTCDTFYSGMRLLANSPYCALLHFTLRDSMLPVTDFIIDPRKTYAMSMELNNIRSL